MRSNYRAPAQVHAAEHKEIDRVMTIERGYIAQSVTLAAAVALNNRYGFGPDRIEQFAGMSYVSMGRYLQAPADKWPDMERAVLKRMEYEERVMPQIEAARAEMRAIEAAVDAVSDPMEREVLRLRYLDSRYSRPMPWKEVALKLFGDDDDKHQLATFRLHGRALQCLKNRGDEKNGK